MLSIPPSRVIIVDSSDESPDLPLITSKFQIDFFHTNLNSAARQRNFGLRSIKNLKASYSYVSFIDDDVRVDSNYFERVIAIFEAHADAVGVSGVALNEFYSQRKRSWVSDAIGLTGKPCSITAANINIPADRDTVNLEAEWLIGCSTWKLTLLTDSIAFEEDFDNQSVFEDVIFSFRCKKLGRLICDSRIKLDHMYSPIGRSNSFEFYRSWTRNRYRLFRYDQQKSRKAFWFLQTILILEGLFNQLSKKNRDLKRARGLIRGTLDILTGDKN